MILCAHCGKPATCIGKYEAMEFASPACDDCCGHACEDGHCDEIEAEEHNHFPLKQELS